MKVDSKIYKGIEYVQVSELPQAQHEIITKTIHPDHFIKLLVDGKIIRGCLQYKDYCNWYSEHFQPRINAPREPSVISGLEIKPNLA